MNSDKKRIIIENLERCVSELNKLEYDESAIEDLVKIQTYLCEVILKIIYTF